MATQTAADVGSSSITTLGTISTGVWNGTANTTPYGGTGMTTGVAYNLLTGGTTTTSAWQNVSGTGSAGQILLSNGSSALPSWGAAPSGSTQIGATQTASASATIEFGSVTGYKSYYIYMRNATPSTTANMIIRISTDGGATWKSGASDYRYHVLSAKSTTIAAASVNSTASPEVSSSMVTTAGKNRSMIVYILDPAQTSGYPTIISRNYGLDSTETRLQFVTTQYNVDAAINGVQFLMSTGNIATGTFSLFGVK